MGTIYRRVNPTLARVTTTKLLSITTAETLLTLGSTATAFEINNIGTTSIYYGNSGVLTNSGGLIAASGAKYWDHVQSGFQLYLVMVSGGIIGRALVHEYEGE